MARDSMEAMPMSPRQSPAELGNAVIAWARGRRGRTLIISAVFVMVLLGLMGARHSETITSSYQSISNYHLPSWRPHLPNLPSIISSPLKPSNTTLELENGEIETVPSHLNKATPNFHLLMPALSDDADFCKTTLSAMLLNYPPPTIINIFESFADLAEREMARLTSILDYLKDTKLVNDEDLVLIVDGHDTWFQLPSEVMIRQYQNVLSDGNKRLLEKYGMLKGTKVQRFNQTIVFGAEKICEGEDLACRYAPESMLPHNIYGRGTGKEAVLTPARYLNSGTVMGPAKDLRTLYAAAVAKFKDRNSQSGTAQSVIATIFGEQQLARENERKSSKTTSFKFLDWFSGAEGESTPEVPENATTILQDGQRYEFSIGLDYTHSLFQPLIYTAEDELLALPHDNSTDLSAYHHTYTPTPPLSIPSALQQSVPPFYTPDLSTHNPSPNEKPAFIEPLQYQKDIDQLKPPNTPWASLPLIQNTYTGAISPILHLNLPAPSSTLRLKKHRRNALPALTKKSASPRIPDPRAHQIPRANITWTHLWYSGYERALLRKYFRTPQSPIGFHNALVGGDRLWDQRGGRGGVWTARQEIWLPWGEVDGVCGTVAKLNEIFSDGKGVWLHEKEEGGGVGERVKQEEELKKKIEEMKEKEEEKKKKVEEEEKKKKVEEEEEDKKKEEQRKKQAEENRKQNEELERTRKKITSEKQAGS
ncbi:uncharacterized protein BDR25DRAFT_346072 [Lindgomyces ingoldianus]|uniref:Uncharacterized protein n=1 Tax=Lindgomyces ingoldianus TaxID=673940 RepID=A0ACB6QGA8_9PLEO|nr:uncharacterized protein BDR25DRAFT_346072 [Lindgomyces ingoldianus]KAF2465535.1 hypothetical protein BDR25DRAFT_346072 [Lindgomyces ingoldianus]